MPTLDRPRVTVRVSFLDAMEEMRAEGRGDPGDTSMTGMLVQRFGDGWRTPEGFAAFVEWLLAQAIETTPRAPGMVPATELWWVEGNEFLGRLSIRHRLTPTLLEAGGHIGYDVRPSARRRGHATAMLREALPVARALGIDPALLTCDATNVASRTVIERNGGMLEDQRGGKLRFWVPTGAPGA